MYVKKIHLVISCVAFAITLSAQNVGIGTTTPLGKLHIKGSADTSQLIIDAHSTQSNNSPLFKLRNSLGNDLLWMHTDDTSNIFLGLHAGSFNSISGGGAYNTFVGSNAGKSNTTGPFNTAIGAGSFLSNSTGANNTAIGSVSLFSNSSGINNTASGSYSLSSNSTGSENTTSGYGSLFSNTSGDYNTAMGVNTLFSNVTGSRATAIGYNAMQYSNNTGDAFTNYNVAVGYEALRGSTDPAANLGNDNTALGYQTLRSNTTGEANTASGSGALFYNTTGLANTATGTYALNNNTTGSHNTALGYRALEASIAGDFNTATGSNALSFNTIGMWNTGIGSNALLFNQQGSANVALGNATLLSNISGSSNTANGTDALFGNISGSSNTALGYRTLYTISNGENNTAIGYKADVAGDDIVNATAIGSNAYSGASNSVVIGSINGVNGATANANVGIGNATPHSSAALEVKSTDKGVLVPRIALTAANVASPVTSPADALLVYNTATAGAGMNAVEPGFYYWNSSASRWNNMSRTPSNESSGFGSWGDCSANNVSEYNPVADENGESQDYFGTSVSISGNYAIVGAMLDEETFEGQGSASFYHYNGNQWVFQQKITDVVPEFSGKFGTSVCISGTYAIVGAPEDGPVNIGSASIYEYNGTNWVLMQKITDASPQFNAFFGVSVSISGNYAIVGAYGDDVGPGPTTGSASVYEYNGTNWVLMQQIVDATGGPDDWFGVSVSISDDRAIVGAYKDDIGSSTDQGSASIYQYNGTNWVLMQKVTDNLGVPSAFFGKAVSLSGDYAFIGAPGEDVGGNSDQGSASIFNFNGTNWLFKQKLIDPGGAPNHQFGYSVSISGNLGIAGIPGDDVESNLNQGSATMFQRVGTGWQKLQYLTDPGGSMQDVFGSSVAIDDTNKRFVVGALGFSGGVGKVVFGKLN